MDYFECEIFEFYMFGIRSHLATGKPSNEASILGIEPYVEVFHTQWIDKRPFLLPFQLIGISLGVLIISGVWFGLILEWKIVGEIAVGLTGVLGLFYFLGTYLYAGYSSHARHIQLELDHKYGYIHYRDSRQKILFHRSQILSCTLYRSLLLPYRLDSVSLQLVGGKSISLSSLVVDPSDFILRLQIDCQVREKVLNPYRKRR